MLRLLRHAVLASTLLAGSSLSVGSALADPGDIIFARSQDADSLDVARVSTTISFQVMQQIYDNLLSLDDKGHVVGGLAASAEDENAVQGAAPAAATALPLARDGAAAGAGWPALASCVVGSFRVGPV